MLPGVVVEDPEPEPGLCAALRAAGAVPALDAPLVDAAALRAAVAREGPVAVNVKPARVGALRELFELYATAAEFGLEAYAGGSFELGPGRRQLRLLAACLHPDGPNDAADPSLHADPELPTDGLATDGPADRIRGSGGKEPPVLPGRAADRSF
jgi:hypothetical protein